MATDKFTCVSVEECVISHSYAHNSREESPNYAIKERAQLNESFLFDVETIHNGFDFATAEPYREKRVEKVKNLQAYEEYCKSIYSEKVGQKPQKKTRFLKEAVVVIDESTTLEQMKELSYKLGKIAGGWKPLQLFIHRDEGHNDLDTGERIWNYHAHIVFDTQDKDTGKTLKVNSKHYQEMQTIASEVLGMRRGEHNPDRKHLNAQDYKKKKRLEEVEKLKKQKEAFLATLNSLNKQKYLLEEKVANLTDLEAKLKQEVDLSQQAVDDIINNLSEKYAELSANISSLENQNPRNLAIYYISEMMKKEKIDIKKAFQDTHRLAILLSQGNVSLKDWLKNCETTENKIALKDKEELKEELKEEVKKEVKKKIMYAPKPVQKGKGKVLGVG
jgi:hypothetical protein